MSCSPKFVFRLYSANRSAEMKTLMERLSAVVKEHCEGEIQTEVIDVLYEPERAVEANVFATPMLIKELPEPAQRVLGDLSDARNVLVIFGLLKATGEGHEGRQT